MSVQDRMSPSRLGGTNAFGEIVWKLAGNFLHARFMDEKPQV